jgi:pimeloyl-ACP methyl ester carboxylesterase
MQRLMRDGVALAFEDGGRGESPLLFVHGLAGDRRYFAPQAQHFGRAHRTVSVDLRGHGESDRPVQAYTMEGFAADLAWLCDRLRIEKPVVIGHSMGGVVALMLAAHYPELPAAVVLVDMPTFALVGPPEASDPREEILAGLRGPAYPQAVRQFVERMFLPTDDPERRAWIVEGMTSAPQHFFSSTVEQAWGCDLAGAASACSVPALYIQAAKAWPALERLAALCPQLVFGRTVGAGHFNMLEVPQQVNAMIERFLTTEVESSTREGRSSAMTPASPSTPTTVRPTRPTPHPAS